MGRLSVRQHLSPCNRDGYPRLAVKKAWTASSMRHPDQAFRFGYLLTAFQSRPAARQGDSGSPYGVWVKHASTVSVARLLSTLTAWPVSSPVSVGVMVSVCSSPAGQLP